MYELLHPTENNGCDYLSQLGLVKLRHEGKDLDRP